MSKLKKGIGVLIILLLLQVSVVIMQSNAVEEDIFKGVDISKNGDGSVVAVLSQDQTTLTISGTGEMKDLINTEPWYSYREKITTIKINQGVISLGLYAFSGCSSLTSIEIPNSVTSIGDEAFINCSNLSNIKIPNSVTRIGYYAFSGCSSLESIEIPSSVISIGESAFSGCSSLISITVDLNNTKYTFEDGILFNKEKTHIIKYLAKKEGNSYKIPNSVTTIRSSAFEGCSNLNSIEIPNSVTKIGDYAFSGCSSLTSIEIPNGVTSIGNSAFQGCSSLTSIEIPNSVKSIGNSAFYDCGNLSNIEIPSSVSKIGTWAFVGCSSLTSIKIPNSVTSIYTRTFEGCSSLTSIEIPNSVTSIGYDAFYGCSSLTSIEIPNSITTIGSSAFEWCSNLTSIKIPSSVTSIGESAFHGCKNLTITCKGGTTAENYAKENNIKYIADNEVSIANVEYSTKKPTNQDVTVTITAGEELRGVTGWDLSEDRKILTKTYQNNVSEEITIKDLVGNESKVVVSITNIVAEVETTLEVNTYELEKNTIKNIQPSTNYNDFINNITSNKEITVKEGNTTVTGETRIKTGQVLTVGNKAYTLVVTGDTNGDGQANVQDILQINKHRLNKVQLTSVYFTAGDINKDGKVDIRDILQLNKYRLGKISNL